MEREMKKHSCYGSAELKDKAHILLLLLQCFPQYKEELTPSELKYLIDMAQRGEDGNL